MVESETLVTVLFTDVEDSTDLFSRLGDEVAWHQGRQRGAV
jgi:class 3 adenylate cyclase